MSHPVDSIQPNPFTAAFYVLNYWLTLSRPAKTPSWLNQEVETIILRDLLV
jgi:hypothetical protein